MRFLINEHESITALLYKAGYSKEDFSFTKKKGQLHIVLKDKASSFVFFRKKESKLNQEGKFEDTTTFYLGLQKETQVSNWTDVLKECENWLKC